MLCRRTVISLAKARNFTRRHTKKLRGGGILMQHYYTHGSSRVMTPERCTKFCELISESHTIEEAAEAIGVSIRTIQRERKRDEDFDHEVRLALQKTPDPLKLMEQAARTHWRAAAWLLERRNPEEYARKPVNATSPKQVAAALRFVQEAALEAVPQEFHEALYQHVQAAMEQAFHNCFPTMGKWGQPKFPQLPVATPLADAQADQAWHAPAMTVADCDEQGNVVPSPVERAAVAAHVAQLSPKTCDATAVACGMAETGACRPDAAPVDPLAVSYEQAEEIFAQRERERQQWQGSQEFLRLRDVLEKRERVLFPAAPGSARG